MDFRKLFGWEKHESVQFHALVIVSLLFVNLIYSSWASDRLHSGEFLQFISGNNYYCFFIFAWASNSSTAFLKHKIARIPTNQWERRTMTTANSNRAWQRKLLCSDVYILQFEFTSKKVHVKSCNCKWLHEKFCLILNLNPCNSDFL